MKKNLSLFLSFFKVGIMTFGGGLAMLPMLTREVVERQKWATEEELLDYYAIGQCTPGIIAVNVATFVGYREGGLIPAAFATLGVLTPSVILITLIAMILLPFLELPAVVHALAGIRVVICALIMTSVLKMARKNITHWVCVLIAACSCLLAVFTGIPTVLLVILSALAGLIYKLFSGGEAQ